MAYTGGSDAGFTATIRAELDVGKCMGRIVAPSGFMSVSLRFVFASLNGATGASRNKGCPLW